jgi:branched-chain amino acid aminotransferase
MNIFFVFEDGSLMTPPLGGTILPGITRDAIIALARRQGHVVREERYAFDQWRADARSGKLLEAFACGTAAVISPIGEIKTSEGAFTIGDGAGGPVAASLKKELVAIQRGEAPDSLGWVHKLA